jgi:MSHA pilin protein MshD
MSTRSRGVTLVELIVFMVIVGVALAGLFAAFNTMTRGSIDPQVRKQMLAIAESLMDEIALMPHTYCDPDDPQAVSATTATVGATGCYMRAEAIGADTGFTDPSPPNTVFQNGTETRYSTTARFDNVNDYNGFSMNSGILDIAGSNVDGLGAYSASVAVAAVGTAAPFSLADDMDVLRITVTVSHGPSAGSVTLDGYRTRYAPNTTP